MYRRRTARNLVPATVEEQYVPEDEVLTRLAAAREAKAWMLHGLALSGDLDLEAALSKLFGMVEGTAAAEKLARFILNDRTDVTGFEDFVARANAFVALCGGDIPASWSSGNEDSDPCRLSVKGSMAVFKATCKWVRPRCPLLCAAAEKFRRTEPSMHRRSTSSYSKRGTGHVFSLSRRPTRWRCSRKRWRLVSLSPLRRCPGGSLLSPHTISFSASNRRYEYGAAQTAQVIARGGVMVLPDPPY